METETRIHDIYMWLQLCLMFNSLFSFMRLKDLYIKLRTSTFLCTNVLSYDPLHLCSAKEILTVYYFSTNNRTAEQLKLQSCVQVGCWGPHWKIVEGRNLFLVLLH